MQKLYISCISVSFFKLFKQLYQAMQSMTKAIKETMETIQQPANRFANSSYFEQHVVPYRFLGITSIFSAKMGLFRFLKLYLEMLQCRLQKD